MTATPRSVKTLTQVNSTDTLVQIDGQVASLNDGGYVVVWTDSSLTYNPTGTAIVAQRYDSFGNKVGGEVKISQFSSGDQLSPAIAALPNGNVAIAFVDTSAGNPDLYVRVFDASLGLVRTDTIDVSTNVTITPSITAFANGSYVITYTAGQGSDTDIVARIVSSSGTVGGQFDIDNQADNRDMSEVARLSNGNFVVTYVDEVSGSGTDTGISYAVFSPAGAPVAGPAIVPGGDGVGLETDPDVAGLREGGFVVVWTDPDLGTNDIRASLLNSNGTAILSDFLVNTTTAGDQNEASVIALADGGFLVTWEDDSADLVRAQRFDPTGTKIGTEFTVKNGTTPSSLDSPEAALLTDGGRIAYAVGDFSIADTDVMTSVWRARDVSHDFDGDGNSGVLWRNDSGQVQVWEMNGLGIKTEGGVAHAPVTSDWHIQGAGDFDGDGNNDVLWRHDSGEVYFWEMNGLQVKAEGGVAHDAVPNSWHIQGTGDFDADGKSDILWRHDSGQVYFWEMNGLQVTAEGGVAHAPVPSDWHIFSQFNFV
jgi:FG-GAP-like repeat